MLKAVITDADFFGGEPKVNPDISRYGARGIALNDDNMTAMILMGANGLYKLPGGGIELGELEGACKRRLCERGAGGNGI